VHVAIAPGASLEKDHRLCPSRPPVLVAAVLISRISMLDAARADKVLFRLAGLAVHVTAVDTPRIKLYTLIR
jgi:hypothetical protein